MSIFNHNITLSTNRVQLIPLSMEHLPALIEIGNEPSIWAYFSTEQLHEETMRKWVQLAIDERKKELRYAFTIVEKETGKIAGSTSYLAISLQDKRVEIGNTWMGKNFQGTGLNKHCKYLLLNYGFEELKLQRIELKTDVLNKQSRRAMEKIGATQEGVLRSRMQMHHDRRRDTIYYSILLEEWKEIKDSVFGEFSNGD